MTRDMIPVRQGGLDAKILGRDVLEQYDFRESAGEEERSLGRLAGIVWRKKVVAVLVFLLIMVIGIVIRPSSPPEYKSEAILEIENRKVSFNNLSDLTAFYWDFDRYVSNQIEILQSRGLAKALVTGTGLDRWPEFDGQYKGGSEGLEGMILVWKEWKRTILSWLGRPSSQVAHRVQKSPVYQGLASKRQANMNGLIARIQSRVSAEAISPSSSLIKVSMKAGDGETAQKLLDKYLHLYLERNTARRKKEAHDLLTWLERELKKSEEKLMESEKALLDFVNRHGLIVVDRDGFGQLSDLLNRTVDNLLKSKETQVKLQARRATDDAGLSAVLPGQLDNAYANKLKGEIAALEAQDTEMNGIYAKEYPARVLLRKKLEVLKQRVAEAEKKTLENALNVAAREEELLKEAVDSAKAEALQRNALSSEFALLRKNAETNRDLHRIILKEYNQMGIRARSLANNIHIVDTPSTPTGPVPPMRQIPYLLLLPLAAALGGFLAAYAAASLDKTIRQPEEIERRFDVRRIGVVPDVTTLRKSVGSARGQQEFLAYDEPGTPFSNSIRNIQATLFPSGGNGGARSLLVTSPVSAEGKTVISVSLSAVLASGDSRKVLLVDCDFRRPRLHKVFDHQADEPGLTSLFADRRLSLPQVVRSHRISGLHYVLAGPQPPDPLHILTSHGMERVIHEMKENFDVVICDCSPVLAFPDSRFLAPLADGVMLVTRQGHVKDSELRAALHLISSTEGAGFYGVVLNRARVTRGAHYYSDYYYKRYRRSA